VSKSKTNAGRAYLQAIEHDPQAQRALKGAQARLRAIGDALRTVAPATELVELLSQAFGQLRTLTGHDPQLQQLEAERQKAFETLGKLRDEQKQIARAGAATIAQELDQTLATTAVELQAKCFDPPNADLESWEHLSRIVGKDPSPLTLHKIYQWAIAWADRQLISARLARLANEEHTSGAGDKDGPRVAPGNEARDAWLYQQCCDGKPYKKILTELAQHPDWERLSTHQAITAAVNRHADRHGLVRPPRRRRGRPTRPK
jgi:hypothetical protein